MSDLIDRFFDTLQRRMPLSAAWTEDSPRRMLAPSGTGLLSRCRDALRPSPAPGTIVTWRLRPRREPSAFTRLEMTLGAELPPLFKRWHDRQYTLDVDAGVARLCGAPCDDPLRPLRALLLESPQIDRIRRHGLLPFGDEAMLRAGPLCFDTRRPVDGADWPVVYWDYDWAGAAARDDAEKAVGPAIFSSFEKLLRCAVHWMEGEPGERPRRIAEFFEIDPAGAGGPGRTYWEAWLES